MNHSWYLRMSIVMFCIRFSFIDALEFDRVLFFWDNLRSEDKDNLQRLTGMQHEIQMQTTQNYDNNKQHEIIISTMTATISIDNNITYIYIGIYIITSKTKKIYNNYNNCNNFHTRDTKLFFFHIIFCQLLNT